MHSSDAYRFHWRPSYLVFLQRRKAKTKTGNYLRNTISGHSENFAHIHVPVAPVERKELRPKGLLDRLGWINPTLKERIMTKRKRENYSLAGIISWIFYVAGKLLVAECPSRKIG